MRSWGVLCAVLLLGLVACDDDGEGSGAEPGPGVGLPDVGDAPDVEAMDVTPEPDVEAMEDVGDEPDVIETECTPGEATCEGDDLALVCTPQGRWSSQACLDGRLCRDGECILDGSLCQEGQRICLDGQTPAICNPGVDWVAQAPCGANEACVDGECRSAECAAAVRSASYLGCDYVAVDVPNLVYAPFGGTPDSPIGIVLTNPSPDDPARFTIKTADGELATLVGAVTVEPPVIAPLETPEVVQTEIRDASGQVVFSGFEQANNLRIPPGGMAVALLAHHGYFEETTVVDHAWLIRTDRPVAAYQFGPYCCNFSFSNDASLLFPIATLGTEYRYLGIPSWNSPNGDPQGNSVGSRATLTVIGTRPNTQVRVEVAPGASVRPDVSGRVQIQGQDLTATLGEGEVLHVFSESARYPGGDRLPVGVDLSGSKITATQPVAVFSGHVCTFYPQDQGACDHVEEQLFPVDTWGTDYMLVPPVFRFENANVATEAIFWKLVANEDDTRIELSVPFDDLDPRRPGFEGVVDCLDKLDGPSTIVLDEGEHCEFATRLPVLAGSDSPFMVMGVISGQDSTALVDLLNPFDIHAGDPAIFLVPPRQQFRNEYAFLAPTTYFNDYLTIVTAPDAVVQLDGDIVDLSDAEAIPGANQVYKHILIEDGPHQVSSSRPTGILVFAFDDYVSYAFTGGLNLIKRPRR